MVDDAIFDFVYEMALRDATMRKAFCGNRELLREGDRAEKAKDAVKTYVNSIVVDGDAKAEDAIRKVWEAFGSFTDENDKRLFSFGNCQKLVNMTAKYMFIATYKNDELRKKFSQCHCPMDSILINKVVDLAKGNPNCEDIKRLKGCSWSRLEYQNGEIPPEYTTFQNAVKDLCEGVYPIEFDYVQWQNQ